MRIEGSTDDVGQRWIKLVGSNGDSEGEIKVKAEKRVDLAMALLGLHGERVDVKFLSPKRQSHKRPSKAKV